MLTSTNPLAFSLALVRQLKINSLMLPVKMSSGLAETMPSDTLLTARSCQLFHCIFNGNTSGLNNLPIRYGVTFFCTLNLALKPIYTYRVTLACCEACVDGQVINKDIQLLLMEFRGRGSQSWQGLFWNGGGGGTTDPTKHLKTGYMKIMLVACTWHELWLLQQFNIP